MEDTKQEDPEFWYTSRKDGQVSEKTTKSRVRSKSHSPSRLQGNSTCNLNPTSQIDCPLNSSSCLVSLSTTVRVSNGDQKEEGLEFERRETPEEDCRNASSRQKQGDTVSHATTEKKTSSAKRKKKRSKARARDRATMQFIKKVQHDSNPVSEQNTSGQHSSCSDGDVDDVSGRDGIQSLPLNTSNLDSEKATPVMACNVHPESGLRNVAPCWSSNPGVHGLCPTMTHNAYVLHWLQQQTGPVKNQHVEGTPRSLGSPCHQTFQAACNACSGLPLHSSPVRQPLHAHSGCACTPSKQDVTNELIAMIQQEASQTPCSFQLPAPMVPCQGQSHIPISPDAQSFLAMLQRRPELLASPCSVCSVQLSPGSVAHPCTNQTKPCTPHGGQACNTPQGSTCPSFLSPPRIQHSSPYVHCHSPNLCSLEHAAALLHQSQLCDSPVRLNTSSLRASYGSPSRQVMMQNSSVNSSQQIFEDSMASSPCRNASADRAKFDDKGASDNPPPIGVFWDIENCAVPRGKSALAVVQSVRDRFFTNHREAEFMCVCDINKESTTVIQELNDAQVTVAHINATAKNAADDKLKQSLRRFADTHNPPATVVLISGDVNFARDLSDLRHRNNLRVILIHRDEASEALKACANEVVRYQDLVQDLPFRSPNKQTAIESCTLIIHNLPCRKDTTQLRNRLRQLSDNCGGKVIHMSYKNAVIQFPNAEKASRAKIRLDGENVFGNKISVAYPKNKLQSRNANSPARYSSKASPQLAQDLNDDMTASDSRGDDDADCSDPKDDAIEGQDGPQEEGSSRSDTEHGACSESLNKDGNFSRSSQPHSSSADSRKPQATDEPAARNASASRIAAAFRPIQHDAACRTESGDRPGSSADSKPVVEIWPQKDLQDADAKGAANKRGFLPVPASTVSLMNWSSTVGMNQQSIRPQITGQPSYNADAAPGLLPFKPAPSVQRIPTPPHPPQGQPVWNPRDYEPVGQSPTLRGIYRPPSPMLANPMGDWQYMSVQDSDNGVRKGAELLVTNLDNKMSRQDLKKCLLAKLNDHCKVLHLIFGSPVPGRYQVVVRVPSVPDAIRAMANINRCQIGSRLVHVSLLMPSDTNADKLRLMIIPMLQEIPGMCLPLCDLKPSFEHRYRQTLYVSDLYQIPDTVTIRETPMGKVVALTTQSRSSTPNSGIHSPAGNQSPASFLPLKEPVPEPCEAFCSVHDCQDSLQYRNLTQDPFVVVSVRTFAAQVHTLLLMHNGKIPLVSFMVCYAAEFAKLTEDYEDGVPLEHSLTCIQGVRVGVSRDGYKTVCWEQSKPEAENGSRSTTPLLPPQLFQFSKEVVELLKHTPRCRLAFSKFIPSYHHHFGRQCRVADYGFLKLIELFDAISHVLQVLGITENKLLTLTHRTQVKRFSQDLLKVLKSQASKQITFQEFPSAYLRCFNKPWKVTDYGVCDLQDLLTEVPETMAMINWNGDDTVVFIPKREQNKEELIRMRKFSREVVDLLACQPRHRILFSKFIPTYHHHFSRQCRVGDYGFNKLLELFEAMEDVIQVEEQGDERVVILTANEQLAVVAHRTSEILQRNRLHLINLGVFHDVYTRCYMYPICLKDFHAKNVQELLARFPHVVEVVSDGSIERLHLVEKVHLSQLAQQMLVVLLETEQGYLAITDVQTAYRSVWHQDLIPIEYGHSRLVTLMKMLPYVLKVQNEWLDDCSVELTPAHQFARRARYVLIMDNRLSMTLQELVTKYHRLYGMELQPANFGHSTLTSLIETVPRVLSLVNKGAKRAVTLNPSCLVPGLQMDMGKTNSLRRLSDQRLSYVKGEHPRPSSTPVESTRPSSSPRLVPSASAQSLSSPLEAPPISSDASVSPAVVERSSSSAVSLSDRREEYATPPEKSSSDLEGRTLSTPCDISKASRRPGTRSRGRCQLAANFSVKGSE
ncbi:meiosis regulator and mRNA stability factor 1-like [Acanthaster planci]|uniref:Meiosis regulator and mRNA stability factor 1 n=1 Tax=Acanthaster planci TaxID=133434 RepID=A0A8B7ZJK1_ACAPL|nr:meiosis regulator and mRNA stability factor 1-like [Acanthaster planci]